MGDPSLPKIDRRVPKPGLWLGSDFPYAEFCLVADDSDQAGAA
jgi:hypothetical protein